MSCPSCGAPDGSCACGGGMDLVGFLSDFRHSGVPGTLAPAERGGNVHDGLSPTQSVSTLLPGSGSRPPEGPGTSPQARLAADADAFPRSAAASAATWAGPKPQADPPMQADTYHWRSSGSQLRPRPPERRRRSGIGLLLAVVGVAAASGAVYLVLPPPFSLAQLSPGQILQRAVAAASKAGTAHVSEVSDLRGQVTTLEGDISASGGTVVSTSQGQKASITTFDGALYFKAAPGLLTQLGLTPSVAAAYANHWITIPATASGVAQEAQMYQTSVILMDIVMLSGPLSKAAVSPPGEVVIHGHIPHDTYTEGGNGAGEAATLAVSTSAPYYPMSITFTGGQTGSTTVTFSSWGETFSPNPPPEPVTVQPGG